LVPVSGNELPGVHIVEGSMPPLQGEGCFIRSGPEGGSWLSLQCVRPETWTPGAAEIAALEAQIDKRIDKRRVPLGGLDRYARYYAAFAENGIIVGKLVPAGGNDLPGVHVMERRKLPILAAEGCVTRFDADAERLNSFDCARPGAWTPSDTQVAELEDLLRHHGGPKLEKRSQHYSGVTEQGRKVIRAYFLNGDPRHGSEPPGPHIHSEVESPVMTRARCGFITLTYDPSSKAATWQCDGPHGNNLIEEGTYDPSSDKTTYKCVPWRGPVISDVRVLDHEGRPMPEKPLEDPPGYIRMPLLSPSSDSCLLPPEFRAPDSGIVETVDSPPSTLDDPLQRDYMPTLRPPWAP
jgi:hypothetical protein